MAEETKEINLDKELRKIQMQILEKIGSGNMNQNELLTVMQMMQKQDTGSFSEMMPMIVAMKMMNPPQKQDQMTPIFLWQMMENMKKSNGGELEKKINELQKAIEKREEDSKFKEVMVEIKEMQKGQDKVGFRDILEVITNKDKIINDIKQIANEKDRELLLTQFQSSIGSLQEEIKKIGSGGDISRVGDTIKQIKEISGILNIGTAAQKSKEEIIKDMVNGIATSFAPAVNNYVQQMGQRQLDQQQLMRIQQIQAQRANPAPPAPETAEVPPTNQGMDIVGKDEVFPDLIDIADSRKSRRG